MIAKHWQKIGLIVVIIACLFNIVIKIVSKTSVRDELEASALYMQSKQYDKEMNKTGQQ